MFKNHKFQFISFCYVYHKDARTGKVNINNDSHLLHITKGNGEITLDNMHRFSLRRGSVVAIPRRTPYAMKISGDFEMLNLHYHVWLENGQFLDEKLRLPYLFQPAYFDSCEQKLRKMHELSGDGMDEALQTASIAYQIVVEHLSSCDLINEEKAVIDERIQRVSDYLSSKDCLSYDMVEVTRIACLSKSQLNRKFREAFGISPHQFWERHRLNEVCLQIKQGGKPFAEIAENFNFSSPYYFSRWFKKNLACSPSAFRNSRTNY